MWGRPLNFECDERIKLYVFRKPNSREVAPAELLYYDVSVDKNLSDVHWMVSPYFVVSDSFIFWAISVFVANDD